MKISEDIHPDVQVLKGPTRARYESILTPLWEGVEERQFCFENRGQWIILKNYLVRATYLVANDIEDVLLGLKAGEGLDSLDDISLNHKESYVRQVVVFLDEVVEKARGICKQSTDEEKMAP